jgi:hypothetical protein
LKAATYISSAGCVLPCQAPAKKVGRGACGVVAKTKAKKQLAPLARGEPKHRLYTRADLRRERLERPSVRCLPGRLRGRRQRMPMMMPIGDPVEYC